MEQGTKKSKLKIIIPIVIVVIIAIIVIMTVGTKDKKFKEVAHVCNELGQLPGMIIQEPKVLDVWYFEENEGEAPGKDIIIRFTADNTSYNYYQYFTWNGTTKDFYNVCFSKDEVTPLNIVAGSGTTDTQFKLNCSALMLQAMKEENKMKDNEIKKINNLISSGKIAKYQDYKMED